MADVQVNEETWKSAWIEFFVEMVALDPTVESGGTNGLEAAEQMVSKAAAIERTLTGR